MNIVLFGGWGLEPKKARLMESGVKAALGRHAKRPGELCLVLMDDKKVRKMNREFLKKDRDTDVIAFGYQEERAAAKGQNNDLPFGDIFISKGVARKQAKEMGHPLFVELLTLAVHGALHLAGCDDGTAADKKRMFAKQERIVKALLK